MLEELEPCPFCGSPAYCEIDKPSLGGFVYAEIGCSVCEVHIHANQQQDVIVDFVKNRWNKRAC